jgi:protein O-mannosyl-transferase
VSPRASETAALLALFGACLAAYANSFAGVFQFDDHLVIVRETSVQSVSAWWQGQPSIRPLLKLSYALNHASGWGLAGLHAVNLALHLANAGLVWMLLRELARGFGAGAQSVQRVPTAAPPGGPDAPANGASLTPGGRLAALFGAALFALHPVQTEAVTYVSGRSTALAALFGLLSIVCWQRGRRTGSTWLVAGVSPFALAAGLACKETVAVVPLAMVLIAWLGVGVVTQAPDWSRGALRATRVHWLVLSLALFATWTFVPRYRELAGASLAARSVLSNLATQADAWFYLAGQLLRIDRLNADPALPVHDGFDVVTGAAAAAWLALIALACRQRRRRPDLAFAVLWFGVWLLPTNSLLPRLDVANDRQLYVAMLGPAFAVALRVGRIASPLVCRGVVALLIAGLALATVQRNRVFASEVEFWRDAATKAPHNARAFANLGYALASSCSLAQAEQALDVALRLDPSLYQAAINLQALRTRQGPSAQCPD